MCNCIVEINKKLEEMRPDNNTRIYTPFTFGLTGVMKIPRVRIETEKRNGNIRRKPMSLSASFCPFCGKAYEDEPIITNL